MTQASSRSFLSAMTWNTVFMVVSFPMGVATSVVVGRWLGPEGKGEYTLATLVGTLLFTFLNLGIPGAISYFLGGRRVAEGPLIKVVVLLGIALSALGIVVVFGLDRTGWCRYLLGVPRFPAAVWIVVAGVPFSLLGCFLQFVLLAQDRQVSFAAVPALGQALLCGLIVSLAANHALTVVTAVVATVATQVAATSALLVFEQLQVDWLRAPLPDSTIWRRLLQYSAVTHVGNTLHFLMQRVDVLLVSTLLGTRAVGLYSVAYGIAELLLIVPQRLGSLFLPRVALGRSPEAKADEMRLVSSLVFLGSVGVSAVLGVAVPPLIRLLYGAAFEESGTPFLLLLPGACALAMSAVFGVYLSGIGRVTTNALVAAAAVGINLSLNLVLIPRFGINAAAGVSSITYSVQCLLLGRAAARAAGIPPWSVLTSAPPRLIAGLLWQRLRPAVRT